MISGLDAVTNEIARFALDAAWARHQLIASNIANHATAGYQPLSLEFDDHFLRLAAAARPGLDNQASLDLLAEARHSVNTRNREGAVELDREMVELTRNTLHYQAVLTAIEKFGSLKGAVVRGDGR